MKKTANTNRLIALIMSVIMITSLIIVDNRYGTHARADENKTISIEDVLTDMGTITPDEDGNIDIADIEKGLYAAEDGDNITFRGDGYYIKEVNGNKLEEAIASPNDATSGLVKAEDFEAVEIKEKDGFTYAVYTYEDDKYVFRGIFRVVCDVDAPSINITEIEPEDNSVIYDEEVGAYIVKQDCYANFEITADDGTDKSSSGISKVVYKHGENGQEIVIEELNGKYSVSLGTSGRYYFTAYDKTGNPSVQKDVTVKTADGINIKSVKTTATPAEIDLTTKFITNKDLFDVTVEAEEKADDYFVDCYLVYTCVFRDGTQATNEVPITDGKAKITVPEDFVAKTGNDTNKLTMYVRDEFGATSYAFDADGYIVFIDDSKPDVSITNISLENGTSYTYEEYNALTNDDKWTKSISVDVSAQEDNSYLKNVRYKYTGMTGEVNSLIDDASDIAAYSYRKAGLVFGDDGVSVPDGENSISFTAENYLNDTSDEVVVDAYIDNTAPVITLKSSSLRREITSNAQYIVNSELGETITVEVNDATSGTDTVETSIKENSDEDYTPVTLTDGGYTVTEPGYYTFMVKAVDKAGNEITKTASFVIDNTEIASSLNATVTRDGGENIINSGNSLVYTNGDRIVVKYIATGFDINEYQDLSIDAKKNGNPINIWLNNAWDVKVTHDKDNPYLKTIEITYTIDKNEANQAKYEFKFNVKKSTQRQFSLANEKTLEFVYDIAAPGFTSVKFDKYESVVNGTYYYKKTPVINVVATDNFNTDKYEVKDSEGNVIASGKLTSAGQLNSSVEIKNAAVNKKYDVDFYLSDVAGNTNTFSSAGSFVIDTVKPTVEIAGVEKNNRLTSYWNNGNVTLNVKGNDNFVVTSFKAVATRDGEPINDQIKDVSAPAGSVDSTIRYTREGVYNVEIYAYDASGNRSSAGKCSFVIDKTPPEIIIDGMPEDGSELSRGTSLSINISDEYGVKAENVKVVRKSVTYDGKAGSRNVVMDQEDRYGLYGSAICQDLGGKSAKYWLEYTLTDNAGNTVTDKTPVFYVDRTQPKVKITPKPSDTNGGYYNKAVKFDVEIVEQFDMRHKISITDSNGTVPEEKKTFKGNTYTHTVKNSAQGIYNLNIIVTDAFGNSTLKRVRYVIDKEKPVITLGRVNSTNNSNVALGIDITDNYNGGKYYVHVVRKDSSGNIVYEGDIDKGAWRGTEVAPDVTFSEEGDYTVTVTASDKAGNAAEQKETSFRIDKTAPVLSITGVSDTQNAGVTATMSVDEAFSFSEQNNAATVNVKITKKTDASGETTLTTLSASDFSSGNPHTASYSFNEDGQYTITMDATDASGNAAAQVTKTFKVDSKAPVITVKAVDKDSKKVESYASVGSSDEEAPNFVDVSVSVEESFFTTNNVKFTVLKDGKDASSEYFTNYANRSEVSTGIQRFDEDGVYDIKVKAKDELGNEAEEYGLVFTVDNTAPSIDANEKLTALRNKKSGDEGILLNAGDFADISDKGYEALWTVNDTSVFKVDVKMDGIDFVDFSDLEDGHHKMTITVTDEVGHVSSDEFEFVYDGTAPRIIIQGVENGDRVSEPFTMSISLEDSEDIITQISINGKVIDPSEYEETMTYQMDVQEYQDYKIRVDATDIAGNTASTYDSETNEIFSFSLKEKISPLIIIIIIIVIILLLILLILVIIRNRKKNKNK